MRGLVVLCVATLLLAACGGGGGDDGTDSSADASDPTPTSSNTGSSGSGDIASCAFIAGGGAKVTTTTDAGCGACSVSNADQAADGNLDTFASISVNQALPGAGAAVRVTAQPGVTFPAGSNAGAVIKLPGTQTGQTASVELRTYLDGTQQESATIQSSEECGVCNTGGTAQLQRFQTSKPFDAVEVFVGGAAASSTTPAQVDEFCSNSNSAP